MKTQCVSLKGKVIKILPDAQFKIELKDYPTVESLCYLSGKLGKGFNKPDVNDWVLADFAPNDLSRGRITKIL